jgi:8-hydroxy-5-deazaflavin:NADPH oxidoreductase
MEIDRRWAKEDEVEEVASDDGTPRERGVERIAILGGTGPLGRGLALRLAAAGHDVRLGSRSRERAGSIVEDLGELATGTPITPATNEDAVDGAEIVVVAVPFEAQAPTLQALDLTDRIVVNAVNPLGFDDEGPVVLPTEHGSAAEDCQAALPSARVVAAFKEVPARRLLRIDDEVGCDILVAGDDDAAVDRVIRLVDAMPGARGLRCGALRAARYLETLTPILIGVNRRYRAHAGIRLVGVDETAVS